MNTLSEFPPDQFRILGVCKACGWTDWLDRTRLSDEMTIDALLARMSCRECGSRDCGIRIVYVGPGEYAHG